MVETLLSRSAFARKAGISPAAVTIAVKEGRLPTTGNKKIDPTDPVVAEFLGRHGGTPAPAKKTRKKAPAKTTAEPPKRAARRKVAEPPPVGWKDDGSPAAMTKLGRLTLDKVSRLFGGVGELEAWLKSAKLKEDIRAARLKNDIAEGEVISRDLVRTHVIGVVDEAFRRVLTDVAKTVAVHVYSMKESGQPVQKAEAYIAKSVEDVLEKARKKPLKVLRGPRGK